MKNIVVLGSTGSIGTSALSVAREHPGRFRIAGLTAHRNVELLIDQIREFSPPSVAVVDEEAAHAVRAACPGVRVLAGEDGIARVASDEGSELVLSAIVGSPGLLPTMAAVRAGKVVALANKETLVMAGELFMREAQKCGARVLPVDSEHSAVFQCLEGRAMRSVSKVILTASGGPFVGKSLRELRSVRPQDALKHPSWNMGRKITIDSATLMNKGLEVIEAHYLFGVPPESIEVIVHPQSIIHSMVEFKDRSLIAQLSVPDMRAAIAYALSWPERLHGVIPPLNFSALGTLTFREPDHEGFPCLSYAYDALRAGGTMPTVLNAANEVAVSHFLDGRIGFMDIPAVIRAAMDAHTPSAVSSLDDILSAHEWAVAAARGIAEILGERVPQP